MIKFNEIAILLGLFCLLQSINGIPYEISVHTGDVFGAGTDAKVYVTLYGEKGKSKETELDTKNRNDFERNNVDSYELDLDDVGKLKKISIRHDDSFLGAAWFLEKVLVKDKDGCVYVFPCHDWLASNYGRKKVSRDLITKNKCKNDATKQLVCNTSLGMSGGLIKDSQISASSSYDDKHQPFHARLKKTVKGSKGAWCSAFADDTEYLQIVLNKTSQIGGIATQGQAVFNNWVTKYSLSYSTNGSSWKTLQENGKVKEFKGNKDRATIVTHRFKPFTARAIRVHPLAWEGLTNCMRVELYGCDTGNLVHGVEQGIKKEHLKKKKIVLTTPESISSRTILDKSILYLRFDTITNKNTILDQSDLHNNARIVNFARLSRFSEKCGRGVDLNGGDVLLNGESFVNKPYTAVTIAAWVKFYSIEGLSSVFDTIGGKNSTHSMGQYHLEVINGSVRWFHRNERGKMIFHVLTEVIVPAHIWTHIACTYDSSSGYAQVFVNAKFVMREEGTGFLSQDWQVKAGIGEHKGERLLDGLVDEFYMSNEALSQDEIKKLMKRCEFEKECFSPIGMEDLKIKDDQVTASSVLEPHKPNYGRLNLISFFDDVKRSAWCSDDDDKEPYLTIDLRTEKTISGVAVQGASVFDSFVTSYKLCYSHSGRKYDCVKENDTGEALLGSEDKDNIKIHWLNQFFDARFVRFYPLSWYGENICMRVELYGCITGLLSDTVEERLDKEIDPSSPKTPVCSASCGKGSIKVMKQCNKVESHAKCQAGMKRYQEREECIQPSCPDCFQSMGTSYGTPEEPLVSDTSGYEQVHETASSRREDVPGGIWCARQPGKKQYLQIDTKNPVKVTGLGTQGRITDDQWVSKYRVSYSINGMTWNNYTENYQLRIFTGNDDKDTLSVRHLKHPVTARYIRIHPLKWHGGLICMRAEVYGCDHSAITMHPQPLLTAKRFPQMKKIDINQPKKTPKAKPTLKPHTTNHMTNIKSENRYLVGSSRDKVLPTAKKPTTHAQNQAQTQPPSHMTRIAPNPKQFSAGKTSAPKTGNSRYVIGSQTLPLVPNVMYYRISPSKLRNKGLSEFYLAGPQQRTFNHYIPSNVYTNQRASDFHYGNGLMPKIQSYNPLLKYFPSLVPDGLRPKAVVIPPVRAFKSNSRNVNNQRLLPGTFMGSPKLLWHEKMPHSGLSLSSYGPSLYAPNTKVLATNINAAEIPRIPSGTAVRNQYFLPRTKGFPKPRLDSLKSGQVRGAVAKHYPLMEKPELIPPQSTTVTSVHNSIALSLKQKFKNSDAHHFLDERLSKQVSKDEKASKNTNIDRYLDYNWSAFSACSASCGRGVKERYRRCNAMECLADGSEIQIFPCFNPPCKDSTEWSSYSRCSVTCGRGIRTRTRSCDGIECPRAGKEVATIPCKTPDCPVLNLDFEKVDGHVIIDQSGKGNNAFMDKESHVVPYKSLCGHHADLGFHGSLLLEDVTFRKKPKYGVSIACWVNIQGSTQGSHSIFSTSKMSNVGQIIGGYHFEVDDGKVRWFHRSPSHNPVFSVVTGNVIHPNTWYHLVGTYSTNTKKAKVYIDGKVQGSSPGSGILDDDWGYRASIGSFDFDGRFIRAKLDDFFMYDYEISPEQIQDLLSIKCPKKKQAKHFQPQ